MQKFTVSLNFEARVSESAADALEYFVREFVRMCVTTVVNDEFDRIQAEIAGTAPVFMPVDIYGDEGSDAPNGSDSR
jgi:hypothetical protein